MHRTHDVFSALNIQRVVRLRVAVGFFFFNLLWIATSYSQRSLTSFGPAMDFPTGYVPLGLTAGEFKIGRVAQVVAISQESPHLHAYRFSSAGLVPVHSMSLTHSPSIVVAADLDGDGASECLTLSDDGMFISIVNERGGGMVETIIPLKSQAQRFIVADINNDKKKDILLFGKRRTGLSWLAGKGGGVYVEGPLLFPEISIGDLRTTDLNGDGITDILLLNWLTNQLEVYYGIGRGIFSEQAAIDLPSEPSELAISPVSKQRTIQIAVTLPDQGQIGLYRGDGTGDFEPVGMVNCNGIPFGVKLAHLNNDSYFDLVTSTDKGILVFLGQSTTQFRAATFFGSGRSISSWAIADLDADGKADLVLADRDTKRIVSLGNATSKDWPHRYSVGTNPKGLTIRDFNDDGFPDVAVANGASSSLSVLYGRGKGLLDGQQSVPLTENPEFLKSVSSLESHNMLVASHSSTDRVTVIRLGDEVNQSISFSIPTGSQPYVVLAREDSATNQIEMLVRHSIPKEKSLSVSLFEQIGGGQFIERSLRPSLAVTILALTVDALRRDGPNDLIFVTNNQQTKQSTLSIGLGGGPFDFKDVKPLLSYPDSLASTKSLVTGFVNGNAFRDIAIYQGPPVNSLGLVYGRGDGSFQDSVRWIRGVHLASDDAIFFQDVDGDTETDIAYLDTTARAVMVAYGRKDGSFHSPKAVYPATGVTSVRIESMRNSHQKDLILSHGPTGTVSIIFDPFSR